MSWTEEKVEKLKELWGKGSTASQIAIILGGVSRNAVIGKAHRLSLSTKIIKRSKTNYIKQKNFDDKSLQRKSRKSKFRSLLLDKNFEPAKNLSLEELTEKTCKYMEGHPNEVSSSFCGRKTVEKFSYCPLHLIVVFQPRGKVRFAVDQSSGSDDVNKAGWVTAEETPITSPNPAYRLVTGSGGNDNTLPFFQLLQDIDEDLRDPRILIVGFKYLLSEVSEGEVREMIRRSGRFNYKIIQDPGQMSGLADGVTGPTEGWKSLVENQRGRNMSFEDYKNATEKITDQSMNMLYGTRPSDVQRRTSDPRRRHRGM
mgnify:CR=1 FL=1